MSDRDVRIFVLGLCTGSTATVAFAMFFYAIGVGG